ncbi:MAG: DUF4097 family beta strand repeat-containing protein [Bacteroidota bacterium]
MTQSSSKSVSTPKKIALLVLGALTILTFVNILEAGVSKLRGSDRAMAATEKGYEEGFLPMDEVAVRTDADDGELMIEESFKVSSGDNFVVGVNDADLYVETSDTDNAKVEVYLKSNNMNKGRDYFENQNYEVTQDGNSVFVKTYPKRKNFNWSGIRNLRITVRASIPSDFNVTLKTADGDIVLGETSGEIMIQTSDGDVNTEFLSGPSINIRTSDGDIATESMDAAQVSVATSDGDIRLEDVDADDISVRTSDGDIMAARLTGESSVSTSDGDIRIKAIEGAETAVRTSDGDIVTEMVDTNNAQFQTSDGSITLNSVAGDLTAKTSSGNLRVGLTEGGKVYLRSGDGDIHISAPSDYSAELMLRGERVRIASGFQFDGKLKKNEAEGRINGGEFTLEARTSDGEVVFKEN